MSEHVLVVPRTELFHGELAAFEGFQADGVEVCLERVSSHGVFRPRDDVEEDPSLKQIIPYGVVSWDDPGAEAQVFLMRRRRGGSEARLHDLCSIGVGGHINPVDEDSAPGTPPAASRDLVHAALVRELHEELRVETEFRVAPIGLINDDSNPVGQVHLGVVYRIRVANRNVSIRETEQLEGAFVSAREVDQQADQLESWSRYVFESAVSTAR